MKDVFATKQQDGNLSALQMKLLKGAKRIKEIFLR
jgi:hypothetical protein